MITTELKNKRINLSGIDLSNLSDEMHDLIYTACKQNYNLSISLENYKIKGEFYNYVLVLVQADTTYGTNGYYLDLGSYYFTIYEDGYRLDKQITLMNVSDDIQAVNLSINNINKELDTLDTGLEALGETVNKNYDSLDSRITSNENKIGVAESDISNIINTELPKVATDIAYDDGFVLQDKNGNDLTFKTPIKLGDNLTYDSDTNKINATSSGGGNVYLHEIHIKYKESEELVINIYTSSSTKISDYETLNSMFNRDILPVIYSSDMMATHLIPWIEKFMLIYYYKLTINDDNTISVGNVYGYITSSDITSFVDYVIKI